jgi:hypothetical protein
VFETVRAVFGQKKHGSSWRRIPVLIWLLPEVFQRAVILMEKMRLQSISEVFREGFLLLEWWQKYYRPGCVVRFTYPDEPLGTKAVECETPPGYNRETIQ